MTTDTRNVVVIGAGQAAQSLIETLRKEGYDGAITLIGDETSAPYQRPPLSKKYLLGEMTAERLQLRPTSWYGEQEIDLRHGRAAVRIDPVQRRVDLIDGEGLTYDRLALTTGAAPRRLPAKVGGSLEGVYSVRNLADVDAMKHQFRPGARLLVVGGGYIGLEAAAVAAQKGLDVTLVEAAPRLLARVACAETADYFRRLHERHGVSVRVAEALSRLIPNDDGRVVEAQLGSGETIAVDFAIVGVGVTPNVSLAEAAGLTIDNGIAVDGLCRTSDQRIYSAGDCASFLWQGKQRRLESVQNAIDQGAAAARAMLLGDLGPGEGLEHSYRPEPWFWSDQYDVKLQIAGLGDEATHVVTRPGAREGAQSVWYYKKHDWGENLIAVDAMNDPKAYMTGKRMLAAGQTPASDRVGDAAVDLKELLA